MSLLFGNLTQQFVSFSSLLAEANAGNATAAQEIPAAGVRFRSSAGKNASELVYVGQSHKIIKILLALTLLQVSRCSYAPTRT